MLKNLEIHNVVASGSFNSKLSLSELAMKLNRAEYEPEQFPGLVYRIEDPKAAALMFTSGKLVCTGTKSVKDANKAVGRLVNDIRSMGIKVKGVDEVIIQNIVASTNAEKKLDLNKIAFSLEGIEYEPEQFPGLVYRMTERGVVFLIFQSGKVICTGGKDPRKIRKAVAKLEENLKEIGVL